MLYRKRNSYIKNSMKV